MEVSFQSKESDFILERGNDDPNFTRVFFAPNLFEITFSLLFSEREALRLRVQEQIEILQNLNRTCFRLAFKVNGSDRRLEWIPGAASDRLLHFATLPDLLGRGSANVDKRQACLVEP